MASSTRSNSNQLNQENIQPDCSIEKTSDDSNADFSNADSMHNEANEPLQSSLQTNQYLPGKRFVLFGFIWNFIRGTKYTANSIGIDA